MTNAEEKKKMWKDIPKNMMHKSKFHRPISGFFSVKYYKLPALIDKNQ